MAGLTDDVRGPSSLESPASIIGDNGVYGKNNIKRNPIASALASASLPSITDNYTTPIKAFEDAANAVRRLQISSPNNEISLQDAYSVLSRTSNVIINSASRSVGDLQYLSNTLSTLGPFANTQLWNNSGLDKVLSNVSSTLDAWNSTNPLYLINKSLQLGLGPQKVIKNELSTYTNSHDVPIENASPKKVTNNDKAKYDDSDITTIDRVPKKVNDLTTNSLTLNELELTNSIKNPRVKSLTSPNIPSESFINKRGIYNLYKADLSRDAWEKSQKEYIYWINNDYGGSDYEDLPDDSYFSKLSKLKYDNDKSYLLPYNQGLWDFSFEPYDLVDGMPNPKDYYNGLFPIQSVEFDGVSNKSDLSVSLPLNLSMGLPNSLGLPSNLSINFYENIYLEGERFLTDCLKRMYSFYDNENPLSYKLLGYKQCTYKLTYYMLSPQLKVIKKMTYLGIPNISLKYSGSNDNSGKDLSLDFTIVGYGDSTNNSIIPEVIKFK